VPLVCSRSLILQAFPFSETSKILRLLTESLGVRSVIAKGAQRPKSRFGGLLEPFTEGSAHFFLREGRELHTLGGFDLLRSRQGLGRNLAAFAGASLLCEIVLRSATEEAAEPLFTAVTAGLDELLSAPTELTEGVTLAAVWYVVALLGFRPELDACVSCGAVVEPAEPARFDVTAGGIACARCRPRGRVFDPCSRAELRAMVEGARVQRPVADPALHRTLLRVFVGTHVTRDSPLRSLDFFLHQLP
jgi:DNA repair protein RecO (recombination protein O)